MVYMCGLYRRRPNFQRKYRMTVRPRNTTWTSRSSKEQRGGDMDVSPTRPIEQKCSEILGDSTHPIPFCSSLPRILFLTSFLPRATFRPTDCFEIRWVPQPLLTLHPSPESKIVWSGFQVRANFIAVVAVEGSTNCSVHGTRNDYPGKQQSTPFGSE